MSGNAVHCLSRKQDFVAADIHYILYGIVDYGLVVLVGNGDLGIRAALAVNHIPTELGILVLGQVAYGNACKRRSGCVCGSLAANVPIHILLRPVALGRSGGHLGLDGDCTVANHVLELAGNLSLGNSVVIYGDRIGCNVFAVLVLNVPYKLVAVRRSAEVGGSSLRVVATLLYLGGIRRYKINCIGNYRPVTSSTLDERGGVELEGVATFAASIATVASGKLGVLVVGNGEVLSRYAVFAIDVGNLVGKRPEERYRTKFSHLRHIVGDGRILAVARELGVVAAHGAPLAFESRD